MQVNIEVPATAAGVSANKTGLVGLVDRKLKVEVFVVVFASDVDVGGVRAHREAGDQAAFDQFVRIVAHDVPILARSRLALVGVDHEICRPAVRDLGHERPLHAGGKPGAAAPAQPGRFHLVDDRVAPAQQYLGRLVPVTTRPRARKTPIVLAIQVGENPIAILQHLTGPERSTSSVRLPVRTSAVRSSSQAAAALRRA